MSAPRAADTMQIVADLSASILSESTDAYMPKVGSPEHGQFVAGLGERLPRLSITHDRQLAAMFMAAWLAEMERDVDPTDRTFRGISIAANFFEDRALAEPALSCADAAERVLLLIDLARGDRLPDDDRIGDVLEAIRDDFQRAADGTLPGRLLNHAGDWRGTGRPHE